MSSHDKSLATVQARLHASAVAKLVVKASATASVYYNLKGGCRWNWMQSKKRMKTLFKCRIARWMKVFRSERCKFNTINMFEDEENLRTLKRKP